MTSNKYKDQNKNITQNKIPHTRYINTNRRRYGDQKGCHRDNIFIGCIALGYLNKDFLLLVGAVDDDDL